MTICASLATLRFKKVDIESPKDGDISFIRRLRLLLLAPLNKTAGKLRFCKKMARRIKWQDICLIYRPYVTVDQVY